MTMGSRNELGILLMTTVLAVATLVLGASNSTGTNSTATANVTIPGNATCPPGLYVAVNANLAIDARWIARLPQGSNITLGQVVNTTEALIKAGKCSEALFYLTHIRSLIVQAVVQSRRAEIINSTLNFRLRLLNETLTILSRENATNVTQLYGLVVQLSTAVKSGNYTLAGKLVQEIKSMITNATGTVEARERVKVAMKINKELDKYVILIIRGSANLNETLTKLNYLEKILNYTANYVKLNMTKVQLMREIKDMLREMRSALHANKAEERGLIDKLKSDKDLNNVLNDVSNYARGKGHGRGR
jgi:hypothetical protein